MKTGFLVNLVHETIFVSSFIQKETIFVKPFDVPLRVNYRIILVNVYTLNFIQYFTLHYFIT